MLIPSFPKIPLIDIDLLKPGFTDTKYPETPNQLTAGKTVKIDEEHVLSMQEFHTKTKSGVHPARTLDSYADPDLCDDQLKRYNVDQVLSRWFENHHAQASQVRLRKVDAAQGRRIDVVSRLRRWFPRATGWLSWTADTSASDVHVESQPLPDREAGSNRLIVVVSQLWLFKFGGESPATEKA